MASDHVHATRPASGRLLLPALFAPVFMVILDVFIVNVTIPSLQADLGASESDVQWVVAAYLLSYAVFLITGGRLGDVVGRRRMFRLGVAGFTVASALCAAAPTVTALIAARLLQGLAGAAMTPQVLAIVQVELPPADRPRAFGFQGLVQGLASIAGQIVGGGLIALDVLGLGWRALVTRARERAPAMVPAREAAWPRAERRGSSGAWFAVAPGGRPRVSALPSSRPPPPRR